LCCFVGASPPPEADRDDEDDGGDDAGGAGEAAAAALPLTEGKGLPLGGLEAAAAAAAVPLPLVLFPLVEPETIDFGRSTGFGAWILDDILFGARASRAGRRRRIAGAQEGICNGDD